MKLDTSHAHSKEAITAINNSLNKSKDHWEILHLLLTEWADDEDLLDIANFLKERLDKNYGY